MMDINQRNIYLSPIYFYNCDEFNLVKAGKTKSMLLDIVSALKTSRDVFETGSEAVDFCLKLLEAEHIKKS